MAAAAQDDNPRRLRVRNRRLGEEQRANPPGRVHDWNLFFAPDSFIDVAACRPADSVKNSAFQANAFLACSVNDTQTLLSTAVSAGTGLVAGLALAHKAGLGTVTPAWPGIASSCFAACGAAAAVVGAVSTLQTNAEMDEGEEDATALPVWTYGALAGLCTMFVPIPLAVHDTSAILVPGAVGAVVSLEVMHRRWACIDGGLVAKQLEQELLAKSGEVANAADGFRGFLVSTGRYWYQHLKPTMQCNPGLAYFAAHLAATYFSTHLELTMTDWRKGFINRLQERDMPGMHDQLLRFVPLAASSALVSNYSSYLTSMWELRWREELTEHFVQAWLDARDENGPQAFEWLQVDNFDQRIAEDTALFASSSRTLLCGLIGAILRFAVFFPALVHLAPNPAVWQALLVLSLGSSLMVHRVGQPLALRSAAVQGAEADFRSALMSLRMTSDDSSAMLAEATEALRSSRNFEQVKAATWLAARASLGLSAFTSVYGMVGGLLPFVILLPPYMHGDLSLGVMFQIEAVASKLRQSLDFVVGAYGDIAELQASASRMFALENSNIVALRRRLEAAGQAGDARGLGGLFATGALRHDLRLMPPVDETDETDGAGSVDNLFAEGSTDGRRCMAFTSAVSQPSGVKSGKEEEEEEGEAEGAASPSPIRQSTASCSYGPGSKASSATDVPQSVGPDGVLRLRDSSARDSDSGTLHMSVSCVPGDRIVILYEDKGEGSAERMPRPSWPAATPRLLSLLEGLGTRMSDSLDCEGVLLVTAGGFRQPKNPCSLRELFTHPGAKAPPDESIHDALEQCEMLRLAQFGFGAEVDWGTELSAQARQCLVFCKVLASWPAGVRWLLLDGADGELDGAMALTYAWRLAARAPADAGVILATRHSLVAQLTGWRRLLLDAGGNLRVDAHEHPRKTLHLQE